MKVQVQLCTSSYRGDHSSDVRIAHEIQPGETVEQLCDRLIHEVSDWIELRIIQEPTP